MCFKRAFSKVMRAKTLWTIRNWLAGTVRVSKDMKNQKYGGLRIRKWQPTPVLLPGKSHGWRSLVGYSPWGCKESDMTEWLHFTRIIWNIWVKGGHTRSWSEEEHDPVEKQCKIWKRKIDVRQCSWRSSKDWG